MNAIASIPAADVVEKKHNFIDGANLASKIAGHSYYHGDAILSAIFTLMNEKDGIAYIKPAEKDYPPYLDYPKERKKQTNADKYFRNATDEELAEIIAYDKSFDKFCDIVLAGANPGFCDDNCKECAINWLKQEAKNDGT